VVLFYFGNVLWVSGSCVRWSPNGRAKLTVPRRVEFELLFVSGCGCWFAGDIGIHY